STLVKILSNLTQPSSGLVIFQGELISGASFKKMKKVYRNLQFVFQDSTTALNPRLKIGKQILYPMLDLGIFSSKNEAKQVVLSLLKKVGLKEEYYHRYPYEFSGGQRQRICIARALAVKPKFL